MRQLEYFETTETGGGKDSAGQGCVNGMSGAQAAGLTGTAATAAACAAGAATAQAGGTMGAQMGAGATAAIGVNGFAAAADTPTSSTFASEMDSGGSGGGGKVICTELCRNGVIEHDVWMADLDYSRKHFSEQTMRGYHLWGVPYVKLMRKSPLFAKLAQYPTQAFAQDIAYRMGVRAKPNYMGWALRELAFRPVCWSIGVFAKARDFQHLWTGKTAKA